MPLEPETYRFADDGTIPNNPALPFLVYRGAIDLKGEANPEELIERVFAANRWGNSWRNGVYPYPHYHSTIHEAMALARGRVRVQFGGAAGREIDLGPGDACVLPAGTGHQGLWSSPDLVVIGAYPPVGKYDLCRGSKADYARAIEAIPLVPLPDTDPVFGADGGVTRLWCK